MQGFNKDFELIRQSLASIELFREIYSTSEKSATNARNVIDALRNVDGFRSASYTKL